MSDLNLLVLCTGNSCRSQMAEAFLQQLRPNWAIYSAGTEPTAEVHPLAIEVMAEKGLDLSGHRPKGVEEFSELPLDWLITVCGGAKEACPSFHAPVKNRVHLGFEDPAKFEGSLEERRAGFREVRDLIETTLSEWVKQVEAK